MPLPQSDPTPTGPTSPAPPPPEPQAAKQVVTFFDGQNLFYAAREAFGYTTPNYDPVALSQRLCQEHLSSDNCFSLSTTTRFPAPLSAERGLGDN